MNPFVEKSKMIKFAVPNAFLNMNQFLKLFPTVSVLVHTCPMPCMPSQEDNVWQIVGIEYIFLKE